MSQKSDTVEPSLSVAARSRRRERRHLQTDHPPAFGAADISSSGTDTVVAYVRRPERSHGFKVAGRPLALTSPDAQPSAGHCRRKPKTKKEDDEASAPVALPCQARPRCGLRECPRSHRLTPSGYSCGTSIVASAGGCRNLGNFIRVDGSSPLSLISTIRSTQPRAAKGCEWHTMGPPAQNGQR